MMGFRFEMWPFQKSDYQLVKICHWDFWPLCWVSIDTDGPIDPWTALAFEAPPLIPPVPSHHGRCDKGLPNVKSCGPKVWAEEGKKRKWGGKWGSLSCGALPLKASWPAICADSLAIATTPGRYSGERKPGMKGGKKRRGSLGTWDTRMSGCKFQDAVNEEENRWAK